MYSVGIDTAHQFLVISLMNDEKVIDGIQETCLKHQSEYLVPRLDSLLARNDLQVSDIDNWVVTEGPGSYTGVRIAMTLVKVIGSLMNKNVYTLSTLQLYAGRENCWSIIDARAKRVYVGLYENGQPLRDDFIMTNDEMQQIIDRGENVIGDLHVFGREDRYGDLCQNFMALRDKWKKVEDTDRLTPVYLKSSQEYLK